MVDVPVDGIGQAVVAHINNDEKIFSMNGLIDAALGFSASETGAGSIHQIAVSYVTLKCRILIFGTLHILTEFHKVIVHTSAQIAGRFHGQHLQRGYGKRIFQFAYVRHTFSPVCLVIVM